MERINKQLQREIALILESKIKKDAVKEAIITGVDCSRDLERAKVYINALEKHKRPGILKAAIATYEQDGKLSEEEILPIRACGRLSGETGLSVHIHTDPMIRTEDVVFAAQAAIDAGAEPDKVHICHMDNRLVAHIPVEEYLKNPTTGRNISLDTQKELLSMGVTIGLDTWGMPIQNSSFFATDDFERLKALINLVDLGYEDKITIGHDFSSRIMGRTYGGYGCSRFMEFAIPVLKQLGYENVIPKITIDNPARILSR